jgi:AraC-like DNA-binding protein
LLTFEDRLSDSPLIERVWRSWSVGGGPFLSVATTNLEIVFSRVQGHVSATLRGPETRPSVVACPADGEWTAIRFRPGVRLAGASTGLLIDRNIDLPFGAGGRFALGGGDWSAPGFDDAEAFVGRLVRAGVLTFDQLVHASIAEDRPVVSPRAAQRRFIAATGMSFARLRQVHRARRAAVMLQGGASILDTAFACGYFDQAHLTRSLRAFIGETPARILHAEQQLSFLYKTAAGSAD